jgi:hypothetical protein
VLAQLERDAVVIAVVLVGRAVEIAGAVCNDAPAGALPSVVPWKLYSTLSFHPAPPAGASEKTVPFPLLPPYHVVLYSVPFALGSSVALGNSPSLPSKVCKTLSVQPLLLLSS